MAAEDIIKMLAKVYGVEKYASLKDQVEEHSNDMMREFDESETSKKIIKDAYGNSLASIGNQDKVASFTNYGFSNDTLNFWLWISMYNDSWVFKKAIDKPSTDMVRVGFNINGTEDYKDIYNDYNTLSPELIKLCKWGTLFGGSVSVIMCEGMKDEDYQKPLKQTLSIFKEAKKIKMYTTDRWYGCVQSTRKVSNMNSLDYDKPYSYEITFSDGKTLKIHHDYILRYEHRDAPNLIKRGQLQGWGYAEGAHIINELLRDDQIKCTVASLLNKALIEVVKMDGMRGAFMGADSENEEQLTKRLEMVNWARTYNSLTLLDTNDEYSMNEFSGTTGLADLIDKQMWLVSAATNMPGILFGDLKNGMGNDQDALERYAEEITNRDEDYFRPIVNKLLHILFLIHDVKGPIDFEFKSLMAKKHDEEKVEGMKRFQELLSGMLSDGVITTSQYAKFMMNYSTYGKADIQFDNEEIKNIDERAKEENEDIDNFLNENQGLGGDEDEEE